MMLLNFLAKALEVSDFIIFLLFQIRPRDLTLDLQSPSGTNEKLGQITATFTLMPKTNEDRQEVRKFYGWL